MAPEPPAEGVARKRKCSENNMLILKYDIFSALSPKITIIAAIGNNRNTGRVNMYRKNCEEGAQLTDMWKMLYSPNA